MPSDRLRALLQADGWQVTLIDRGEPGRATSYGKAGILSMQSLTTLNSPEPLKRLPSLLLAPTAPLRLRWRDLLATAPLPSSVRARTVEAAIAWRILLQRCGGAKRVSWPGWLKLAEGARELADLAREPAGWKRAATTGSTSPAWWPWSPASDPASPPGCGSRATARSTARASCSAISPRASPPRVGAWSPTR